MPEQGGIRTEILEAFENGKPLSNLDWDDFDFTSTPEGWVGKWGKVVSTGLSGGGGDFMLFRHLPCGKIWTFAAGIVGPRAVKNVLIGHPKTCQGKTIEENKT